MKEHRGWVLDKMDDDVLIVAFSENLFGIGDEVLFTRTSWFVSTFLLLILKRSCQAKMCKPMVQSQRKVSVPHLLLLFL